MQAGQGALPAGATPVWGGEQEAQVEEEDQSGPGNSHVCQPSKAALHGEGGFTKIVALKVLNPEASAEPEVASRLRDEARVLGLVRHRAIVQVDGLVQIDGQWTVVMEFIDGVDLSHLVEAGPVPPGPGSQPG